MEFLIAAFYKFADLHDFRELQEPLLELCKSCEIRGSILLAPEGINGTIAGPRTGIETVLAHLRSDERLRNLEHKESVAATNPFLRLKVKLKKEIIPIGDHAIDPVNEVGVYVEPEEWNALISDPEVLVLDTRNDYEVAVGSFKGAVDPDLQYFRDFPGYADEHLDPAVHRKVAMFCTGGIRCEKASAYLKSKGFSDVYHLRGGILKYLEKIPDSESLWEGECFVFDNRVSVDHGLNPGSHDSCTNCRWPVLPEAKSDPKYLEGTCCPRCFDSLSEGRKKSLLERQKQMRLAAEKGVSHLGAPAESCKS